MGELMLDEVTDGSIQAWLSAIQQTAMNTTLPMIDGAVSVADFQQAFNAVKERMSSSPSSIHYSTWKVVAHADYLVEWLSIMMNLPFMHGFVNERWEVTIDLK